MDRPTQEGENAPFFGIDPLTAPVFFKKEGGWDMLWGSLSVKTVLDPFDFVMENLYLILALLGLVLILQIVALFRRRENAPDYGSRFEQMERALRDESRTQREEAAQQAKANREELASSFQRLNETVMLQGQAMAVSANEKMEQLRAVVDQRLQTLQQENTAQLDQMRQTVDEKLQSTLEKRLGESFKLVSDRLEQVHKGLGEMQTLATGVGDLQRVLTNVKTRGTWGEVQLEALLEQVLTPAQYERNVATKGTETRVEFAIKLPGRGRDKEEIVWLPIDAKFPQEDYLRLVEAHERADTVGGEAAAKALELRIRACAKDIAEKYLNPPMTTDFGILFLPTEGLYAEVMRRGGVSESIQRQHRVMIAGPSTLWALLNSLQVGFQTLAIEKRSSEIWNLLGAVKTEFEKYGTILGSVQKKLMEASNTIDKVSVRSRAIERKLREVESADPIALLDGNVPALVAGDEG